MAVSEHVLARTGRPTYLAEPFYLHVLQVREQDGDNIKIAQRT
ncbi:MAG: hypothetical protein ACRDN0_39845 [Trebonia sp.]